MAWWWHRWPRTNARVQPVSDIIAPVPVTPTMPSFTPSRPQFARRQSVGRKAELDRILRALREENFHVVLYSERGRGKTSLANLAVTALRREGCVVARHTCEAGSDFDSIIRGLADDLPSALFVGSFGTGEGGDAVLPPHKLRPSDVLALPGRLTCRNLVCVVDEFDRVKDAVTRTLLADTIKQLSDCGSGMLFLLVGVSKNLDEILGQHPSIQRSVVGVDLELLTDAEVSRLLEMGARDSGFGLDAAAAAHVTRFVRGGPYMAHLVGLRLAQHARRQGIGELGLADLPPVFTAVAADVNTGTLALYGVLTADGTDMEMVGALRRIANAHHDRNGRIAVGQVLNGMVAVGGSQVSAACWNRCVDSGAVEPVGGKGGLFAFADRWLMYYVVVLDMLDERAADAAAPAPRHASQPALLHNPPITLVRLGSN